MQPRSARLCVTAWGHQRICVPFYLLHFARCVCVRGAWCVVRWCGGAWCINAIRNTYGSAPFVLFLTTTPQRSTNNRQISRIESG